MKITIGDKIKLNEQAKKRYKDMYIQNITYKVLKIYIYSNGKKSYLINEGGEEIDNKKFNLYIQEECIYLFEKK